MKVSKEDKGIFTKGYGYDKMSSGVAETPSVAAGDKYMLYTDFDEQHIKELKK